MKKIILFEINEITEHLINDFIESGVMPNFKAFKAQSQQIETVADALPPALEPWIQWYSCHTGLRYEDHKVFRLTQGARANHINIWEKLILNDLNVINFGSMNTKSFEADNSLYVPDPWSKNQSSDPNIQPIIAFIAANIQEYTNQNKSFSLYEYWRIAYALMKHGLSFGTIGKIVKQLVKEKTLDKDSYYKRVFILDHVLFDVFAHQIAHYKPHFATFFTNSIAHLQHSYWRDFDPEAFGLKAYDSTKKDAIKNAYINMDIMMGKMMALAKRHNMYLMMASALSQKPYIKEDKTGGRHYYRPHDIKNLLERLNIAPQSQEAVMTHQYILRFDTQKQLYDAMETLNAATLYVDHKKYPLFTIMDAQGGLIFDCHPRMIVSQDAKVTLDGEKEDSFYDIFYKIDAIKSGCHDPSGSLWIDNALKIPTPSAPLSIEKIHDMLLYHYQIS